MDTTSPQDRFLLAYACWQQARIQAAFGVAAGQPPQALALASLSVHWALELDRAWSVFEGEDYDKKRGDHEAAEVLAALAGVRDATGVVGALHIDQAGVVWRLVEDLPLEGKVRDLYSTHLSGRDLRESETAVLEWFLNGPALEAGAGRAALAEAPRPRWQVGDPTPNEPHPELEEAAERIREDNRLMLEEPPEVVEAVKVAQGYRFVTVVHNEDWSRPDHHPSAAFTAWKAAGELLASATPVAMHAVGYTHDIFMLGGPDHPEAEETAQALATVARAIAPQGWEVVEGYRPPQEPDEEDEE